MRPTRFLRFAPAHPPLSQNARTHPEHVERLEWLERPLDPEAFDPNDFAENLRSLRLTTFDHLG